MITRESVPADLLADVKNYLNITWDDETTDAKISGLIASAAAYLDGKLGGQPDYEADGMPRTLMMEYVRYARDSALDVFETNYLQMILTAQQESMVMQNAVESTVQAEN